MKLDAGITSDLKDIADLIAQICGTPVALITLLGKETQWFKAATGVDMESTPREVAFCNYTIKQKGILMVPDMLQDKRFASNPLVASAPNARFYAGATLVTDDGYAIGSLCVVDFEPKVLNECQQKALKTLSKQVINLLQLNWSLQNIEVHHKQAIQQSIQIADSELKLKAVFDSSSDIHMLVDKRFEIITYNKAAANYFQSIYHKQPHTGDNILDYVEERVSPVITRYLLSAIAGRSVKKELLVRPGTQHMSWREVKFVPIKNRAGEITSIAINSVDITRRKMQDEQIRVQNEALTRIAIIQSHELRRPVASLLGLMDLMKTEPDTDAQDYFEMMQTTVNELDQKIRMIVKDSEDTIQSHLSIVA
jgi:PAS domain S-box-containing protein